MILSLRFRSIAWAARTCRSPITPVRPPCCATSPLSGDDMEAFISDLKRENPKLKIKLSSALDDDETWDDVMEDLEENPWLSFPVVDEEEEQPRAKSAYDAFDNDEITRQELDSMVQRKHGLLLLDVSGSEEADPASVIPSAINIRMQDLTRELISSLLSSICENQGLSPSELTVVVVHWGNKGLVTAMQAVIRLTRVFKVSAKVRICDLSP